MNFVSLGFQLFHTVLTLFTAIFPHIYQKYDLYYIIYLFIVTLQWYIFKGECLITYLEKKTLNPSYKLGDDATYSPFYDIIGKSVISLLNSIYFINFALIIYRNLDNKNLYKIIFGIICITIINILVYYKYKNKNKK
jgi:hypothetical protein